MSPFRKDPPRKAKGQYVLHPKADHHTSVPDSRRKPSWPSSEPAYEVRVPQSEHHYAPIPAPSYHGPHFEKGPYQEEIWNTRKTKKLWQPENELGHLESREEYRHRAHSFHDPIQKHKYSDPYEVRPENFTDLMKAEYKDYKYLSEKATLSNQKVVADAKQFSIGRKTTPTQAQGTQIMDGISTAKMGRDKVNRAVQSRSGFIQKYPQSYQAKAIEGHERQERVLRQRADWFRESETYLNDKYDTWQGRMSSRR